MTDDPMTRLHRDLGGGPEALALLNRLPQPVLGCLADAITALHTERARELDNARETMVAHVPALLRGPVRKALSSSETP